MIRTSDGVYRSVDWGEAGMTVWIRFRVSPEHTIQILRCTVTRAAGDALYVENPRYGVAKWVALEAAFVPEADPHARPARISLDPIEPSPSSLPGGHA